MYDCWNENLCDGNDGHLRLGQGDIDFILPQCQRELMKVKPSFQPDEFTWPIHWSALHYDAVLRGAHNAMTTISHTPPPPPPMTLRHHSNDGAGPANSNGAGQQTVMVGSSNEHHHHHHFVIIIIRRNKMTVKIPQHSAISKIKSLYRKSDTHAPLHVNFVCVMDEVMIVLVCQVAIH